MSAVEKDVVIGATERRTSRIEPTPQLRHGVVIGTLLGFKDDGRTPLVLHPQQSGSAAVAAPSIVDLHGALPGDLRPLLRPVQQLRRHDARDEKCQQHEPVERVGDAEREVRVQKEKVEQEESRQRQPDAQQPAAGGTGAQHDDEKA